MERVVIAVNRRPRRSEKLLRVAMAALAALFLLMGIFFSRGMMLPCFLMAMAYFIYAGLSKRAWEYVLENGTLRVDRLTDHGRATLHEIAIRDIEVLARPDDPAVAMYRKGGAVKVPKFDYTSYDVDTPWYTVIAMENGARVKLLMDLDDAAIRCIRRENRQAVRL